MSSSQNNGKDSSESPGSVSNDLSPQNLPYIIKRFQQETASSKDPTLSDAQRASHSSNADKLKVLLVNISKSHPKIFNEVVQKRTRSDSANSSSSSPSLPPQITASPSAQAISQQKQINLNSRPTTPSSQDSNNSSSTTMNNMSKEKLSDLVAKSKSYLNKELEKYNRLKKQYNEVGSKVQSIQAILNNQGSVLDEKTKLEANRKALILRAEHEKLKKEVLEVSSTIEKLHSAANLANKAKLNAEKNSQSPSPDSNPNKSNISTQQHPIPLTAAGTQDKPQKASAPATTNNTSFSTNKMIINNSGNQNSISTNNSSNNSNTAKLNVAPTFAKPKITYNSNPVVNNSQTSISQSPTQNLASVSFNESQTLYSKPQLVSYLKQLTFEEKILLSTSSSNNKIIVDTDVEYLLDELIKEFLEDVIDFSTKLANHRISKTSSSTYYPEMSISDLNLNLERNWGIQVNGNPDEDSAVNNLDSMRKLKRRNYAPTEAYINKLRKVYSKKS